MDILRNESSCPFGVPITLFNKTAIDSLSLELLALR